MIARNPLTGVTEQQERWCFECIRLGDPVKAYRAVYDVPSESKTNVAAKVTVLVDNDRVRARLSHYQAIADRKLEVSVARIAKELARIGFADFADLFDDQGRPIELHMLPEDVRRAIHSVDIVERPVKVDDGEGGAAFQIERVKKIRLHDKHAALLTMGRWKRMVVDRIEHVDPNAPENMDDKALEADLRAHEEALRVIEAARGRAAVRKGKAKTPAKPE